jgi:hypothetical protein
MKKTRLKWGRLACFLIIIIAISGPLLWFGGLLAADPIGNFVRLQGYHQDQCTIIAKDLRYYSSFNQDTGNDDIQYGPNFTFQIQNGSPNNTHVQGYGIDQHAFDQREDAQNILAHYTVGRSYPCWSDLANTSHVVLSRDITTWILLLPGGIMLLIGMGLLIGFALLIRWLWRETAFLVTR